MILVRTKIHSIDIVKIPEWSIAVILSFKKKGHILYVYKKI